MNTDIIILSIKNNKYSKIQLGVKWILFQSLCGLTHGNRDVPDYKYFVILN